MIVETLKGPVADVYRRIIPAFNDLSGDEFYDLVLSNSDLLYGCILIFSKKRALFSHLLVDARGRRVNDPFIRLRCGRTLHDIFAMILRTHAKRHFRAVLGGDPASPTSKAGRLYHALNEYLIHQWQVPLVPHYAPIPVEQILKLGPGILEIREPEVLDRIAKRGQPVSPARSAAATPPPARPAAAVPPPPPPEPVELVVPPPPAIEVIPAVAPIPEPVPQAAPPKRRFGLLPRAQEEQFEGTPQEEFWWQALNDRQVSAVLEPSGPAELRELAQVIAQTGEATREEFYGPLCLSTNQAALCLAIAYRAMGRPAFMAMFGEPGDAKALASTTTLMRARNLGSRADLRSLARFMEQNAMASPKALRAAGRR